MYDEESYMAVEKLPENVQLNVSGLGWNLFRNSLGIKVTPLEIPLETPADDKKIVGASLPGLISEQLNEFQLNYVLTDTLFVNIERRISRTFLLAIDSAGISLDNNYSLVSPITYEPDSVLLQGPQNILNAMSDTIYVKIPQEELDESYNEDVPINLAQSSLIHKNPPAIRVSFEVEEFVNNQLTVPLELVNFPENLIGAKSSIEVNYRVARSRQEDVTPEYFEAVINFRKMDKEDSTILPVLRAYPDYIKEVKLDTARVKVMLNE